MRDFHTNTQEFGLLVSAYTFSAAISGILSSFFLDRFKRKRALIGLYFGFAISTLLCALAGDYWPFLCSRILAGAFGGTLTALGLSIIGDYIPLERRGRATGFVMSAFSLASVIGVPTGLWLAELIDWQAPFFLLAITCIPVIFIAWQVLPPMDSHLNKGVQTKSLPRVKEVLQKPEARLAFLLMIILMLAGFSVIPFISPYLVSNCGVRENQLFLVYLIGGLFTFGAAIFSGRLTDKFGALKVFSWFTPLSVIPIVLVTSISVIPLPWILVITTLFMALLSARLIPIVSIITQTVEPRLRGTFMSLLSSIQQSASGAAAWIAGTIVYETIDGKLEDFNKVGWMAAFFSILAIGLAWKLIPLLNKDELNAASDETIPSPEMSQSTHELHIVEESSAPPL